jgi:pyruvate ferredoxin oxidoreductase gamma subunit
MYRVRFHGRGGQGMKTASRILGTACFRAGYEVQDAPRYGAERRGAPIFAYVRADRAPIRERGVIRNPHLVVVADATLIPVPAAGVLSGLQPHTVLLINSSEPSATWKDRLGVKGRVLGFQAGGDPLARAEIPYIGTACAAAAARLLGFVQADVLEEAVRDELSGLGEAIVEKNLSVARNAFELMTVHEGAVEPVAAPSAEGYARPDWVDLSFEEAGTASPVIHAALTSEAVQTGLWRTLRPVIDYHRCNQCWWVCSGFCPDGAIRVVEGRPEIDYTHCKGCLVCLAQCPPHAIAAAPEAQLREATP